MPRFLINKQSKSNNSSTSLPSTDTYADAILRTFASLEPRHSSLLPTVINDSLDNQLRLTESFTLSSSSSSINENQFTHSSEQVKKVQRLLSSFDQVHNKDNMATRTLFPSSPQISNRYFFRSQSNDIKNKKKSSKTKPDHTSPSSRKRYKFSSTNPKQYNNNIYRFPSKHFDQRAHSSDSDRYLFPSNHVSRNPQPSLTYLRSTSHYDQRSAKFNRGTPTTISDPPYLFSKTTDTSRYRTTTSTYMHPQDTWAHQRQRIANNVTDLSTVSPEYRQSTRMDTVTSTNGLLSLLKRSPVEKSPTVHFEPSSFLTEARIRLRGKRRIPSLESLEKSVDRLVSSVNKKYGHQQQMISPSTSSSLNYVSQYYASKDEPSFYYSIESDDEAQKYHSRKTTRTHTQIMKNVNKSLIDRNYRIDKTRLKRHEKNVRRYLRLCESQCLQRELNYDLIRCFSSSYLNDLRREEIRHFQTRAHMHSYTYEDIQDIHTPSTLEAYKIKTAINREKHHHLQLSPVSSSAYSPLLIGSSTENIDTRSVGFESERRPYSSISQTTTSIRPSVDVVYGIMRERFRGVDASIAGHISKASQFTTRQSRRPYKNYRDNDSDIDIKSSSSFWSDEEEIDQHIKDSNQRKTIPHQRKISRYLSTVNRSLLDRPSDLIADFYLSQLNRNMQESVRHIEKIARDKAYKQEFFADRGRSLSAEHLYQVRKEHLRYQQPFTKPTSFTMEDVADIYKPFALENYKRKIAIELERRRRQRQGQFIGGIHTPSIYISETDLAIRKDFVIVSPPIVVHTKDIIMGRARRAVVNDGSGEIVQHVGVSSPPTVYSNPQRSSSQPRFDLTRSLYDQYAIPHVTTVYPPDFVDRQQLHIRQELDPSDDFIHSVLRASQQAVTSVSEMILPHRQQTKIYTPIPKIHTVEVGQANLVHSDLPPFSMVNIKPTVTINQDEVNRLSQHATFINQPTQPYSLFDQLHTEQVTQYIEPQPHIERSTLIIPVEERHADVQEEYSIFFILDDKHLIEPSIDKVNGISFDGRDSFNTSQINEQPIVFNSSSVQQLESYNQSISLALLLEELNTTMHKQHAIQIYDDLKTYEKVEESVRLPIIVYDTEWKDENIQIISNEFQTQIQHAHQKYPENTEYEKIEIYLPEQFTNQSILTDEKSNKVYEIIDNSEQVTSLSDDSYLIRHQQQSNIHIDELPDLENPLHSTIILTLNYPEHNQQQLEEEEYLFISPTPIDSQTSSFHDLELFLNHFEESLDHEQHLPLINQISLSYGTSLLERYQQKNRSLPTEWFQPTILSHDEQLVEQWTVETDIDTIQQEGTLHRQQGDFITNPEYSNVTTDTFCNNIPIDNHTSDAGSHYSPTSDCETDSVNKDNNTAVINSATQILPSSSITNTSSSPLLTSNTAPIVPIIYFLDALAVEEKEKNNPAKDFLLTIGFGQNEIKMNELKNLVSIGDQPLRPTWINRPLDNIELLPTLIHHEKETFFPTTELKLHFAVENQIDDDETALIIYSHRLQYGHNFGENIQGPLNTFFEPPNLHVPIVNEIYTYRMSFHHEFPLFHPPDTFPNVLVSKTVENDIYSPSEYQINQSEILSFSRIHDLSDNEEEIQTLSLKFDQPTYIEHYHIQPLHPFPETCYAQINQPEICIRNEDEYDLLNQFISTEPMRPNIEINPTEYVYTKLHIPTSTSPGGVRPPASIDSGPIYEDVSIEKNVDVNMGTDGQYKQQATYSYGKETDLSTKYTTIERTDNARQANVISSHIDKSDDSTLVPEQIVEHISEDEKSITSEEVVFEEWSEEFNCRRTDEYDRNTNKLIRSTIDETSERVKGDVIKEEYKEKNVRIKGHKSYNVVKEVYRRVPNKTVVRTNTYEEMPQPPLPSSIIPTTLSSSSKDRQWASENAYTTEIVYDTNLAKDIQSNTQKCDLTTSATDYNLVHPGYYSPVPTTSPSSSSSPSHYERMSTIVTPASHYAEIKKHEKEEEPEQLVQEEYIVELATPKQREDLSDTYITSDQRSSGRRTSDWRNKLKEIYGPSSDEERFDQYDQQSDGKYLAQRASVIPSNTQQRFKEVQVKLPDHDKQQKLEPPPPTRHTIKEVLVCLPRGSSPEKQYHYSSIDDNEQKRNKLIFVDSETPKNNFSTSSTDDDRSQTPKYSSASRTQYERIDRPTSGRVGELKNTFETTTYGSVKDDTSRNKTSITTGLTEQRRRIFEEQEQANKEWSRRPINEFHTDERRMSETHTAPSLVSERVSRIENTESKPTSRIQQSDRMGRTGFDAVKSALESSTTKPTTPQTSIDIRIKNKQTTSSFDSDLSGPTQPIYQSTPKVSKTKYADDAGHESEDELSDSKQTYDARRRTSKSRVRDFSQSTSQPTDANYSVQRTISKFNESNMENILSHVPTSKGKGILIELSPHAIQTRTTSTQDPYKSSLTSDSGVYEYSTPTSHQLPTSSSSWRQNTSTSIIDDTPRSRDHGAYVDSTATTTSPYGRRQFSDADQTTIQNIDDSMSRTTYRYDTEIHPSEPINQQYQQRTVRRQITSSSPSDYDNLANYRSGVDIQSQVPITTQSRSRKPLVVDEIETIETKTQVECQVQRINEIQESTRTERTTSPISSPKKTITTTTTTTTSRPPYSSFDEIAPTKRSPQYYESTAREEDIRSKPIEREHFRTHSGGPHGMEKTSFTSQNQVTFNKLPPNEIVAVVRIPELSTSSSSPLTIRQGTIESNERPQLNYQRVHATNYRPPTATDRQSRLRISPTKTANEFSSPINFPTRSASYHSSFHEQNQQQPQQQRQPYSSQSQTRYHSGSLGSIFGSNLGFEIEIEKRPPHQPEQPTVISLDQSSRATITTSKDGRVSIKNVAAQPGNTVVINSDFHSSDRSLNRSSGYFSADEFRSQIVNPNYSSDEQSSPSHYNFDQVNNILHRYSQSSSNNSPRFNETIDQIDALYNNLNVQKNDQPYDFSKPTSKTNRRRQLVQNPGEYSKRYTSTGFQHIPSDADNNTSTLNNIVMATPIRPIQSESGQNLIVHQNRLNSQSQIVQRNRSVKQMKQKSAAKKRNGNTQEQYSDEDDENDSPLSDNAGLAQSSRIYNFNNY